MTEQQQHTLRLLQQNVKKSRPTMIELFTKPETLEYGIIALQEPWRKLDCNTTYHPAKDHFELPYLNDKHIRVCMYISKKIDLASWSITNHSSDLSTLHLRVKDAWNIHIHNIYNPSPSASNIDNISKILEEALKQDEFEEHIAIGDFNLHHPAWGRVDVTRSKREAETLLEIIETHQMEQVFTPGTVTYFDKSTKSTIDLVFVTPLLKDSLITCQTKEFKYGSDYYPVITHLNLDTIQRPMENKRQFRKVKKKRLLEFFGQEAKQLSTFQPRTVEKINKQVELLTIAIQQSIEFSTPLVQICKQSVPGFDCKCKEAQIRVRQLHKIHQKEGTDKSWQEYVEARFVKKTIIKRAKRREYQESREKACQNLKTMWRAGQTATQTGPSPQACMPALRKANGSLEKDPARKIKLLEQTFFPPPPEANLEDTYGYAYPKPLKTNKITESEITQVIFGPSPYKAPGPSGIPNKILQLLIKQLMLFLHGIFNACF